MMVIFMTRKPLEWAYKNDSVSTLVFTKATLEKYRRSGLLKLEKVMGKRRIYELTQKGLKCYRGKLPKSKCKVKI